MKEVAGINPQPAAPAEVADEGDRMIEAALHEIEADELREMEADKKLSVPKVTGFPAEGQRADRPQDVKEEEVPHEDDPGVVVVDDNNGAPVKVPKCKLKEEAVSMAHLTSHRFKNPYCQACVRGKMRHLYTKKGAFQRELKEWGDVVTMDFVFPEDQMDDDMSSPISWRISC